MSVAPDSLGARWWGLISEDGRFGMIVPVARTSGVWDVVPHLIATTNLTVAVFVSLSTSHETGAVRRSNRNGLSAGISVIGESEVVAEVLKRLRVIRSWGRGDQPQTAKWQ